MTKQYEWCCECHEMLCLKEGCEWPDCRDCAERCMNLANVHIVVCKDCVRRIQEQFLIVKRINA